MATAKKYVSKDGKVSYHIRASSGYDSQGKQIVHRMTWSPKPNMSEKAISKELERQKVLFDEKIKANQFFDTSTTFREYSQKWLVNNKAGFAPKTYERYRSLLTNTNIAIGDIKLINLQTQHLQAFYNNPREEGVNTKDDYATSINLEAKIKKTGMSKEGFAKFAGVSRNTIRKACKPENHII